MSANILSNTYNLNLIDINNIPDLEYEMTLKDVLEDLVHFPQNIYNKFIINKLIQFINELK